MQKELSSVVVRLNNSNSPAKYDGVVNLITISKLSLFTLCDLSFGKAVKIRI